MKSRSAWLPAMGTALVMVLGCDGGGSRRSSGDAGPSSASTAEAVSRWHGELFTYAIDNLNHLEDFDSDEIRAEILRRLEVLASQDPGSWNPKTDSLAMTWPQPDMLRQAVDRLNQWVPTQVPSTDWKLDPLVAQVPPSLREIPPMEDVASLQFSAYDGFMLEEAVWLRDLSNWARGKSLDDLQRAKKLFDWTVRNIRLDPTLVDRTPLLPREVLLLGHGTEWERAWVFILLARQQGLDAAVLARDTGAATRKSAAEKNDKGKDKGRDKDSATSAVVPPVDLAPWCVAVLANGKLYLFDPLLGLPIPAPGAISVDRAGQLDIQPATLDQVAADDRLLGRLDLSLTQRYGVKSADLEHLVLLVEASPQSLSKRMKLLESHLGGQQRLVLTATPSAQVRRLTHAAGPGVAAQVWTLPYETLQLRWQLNPRSILLQLAELLPFHAMPSSPLYRGRVLHLKGHFTGEQGATACYQTARPSNQDLNEGIEATRLDIEKKPLGERPKIAQDAQQQIAASVIGKLDASYWLGLIAFEQGNHASAIDYLTKRMLNVAPNGPWSDAAPYNIARAYEASGERRDALKWYHRFEFRPGVSGAVISQGVSGSLLPPDVYGSLLRARWLEKGGKE
jgi:tetratricopeptide (TPR) repeat protein